MSNKNISWNSFTYNKCLVHKDYWKSIPEGKIPPPLFVSVDLSYLCNYKCFMCNSALARSQYKDMMSAEYMRELADFLKEWGVRAICLGGLGESLMNKDADVAFINFYKNNIKQLLITNGSLLHKFNNIYLLNMLGVSVNAGNAKVYEEMGMHSQEMFYKVINNLETVNKNKKELETTYKFLITPINYRSLYEAVKLAKDIGCNQFQSRPAGNPWFNLNGDVIKFTNEQVEEILEQLQKAREDFEDENFKVYTITHKFNPDFSVSHNFNTCWAVFVTCHASPRGYWGLCCDRRQDESLALCYVKHPQEVLNYWGKKKHFELANKINLKDCPRCTLGAVQNMFEHVIIKDDMNVDFI